MVYYKGQPIAVQIIDMVVDGKVVVEAKSTADIRPAWGRQLQNYLCATEFEVGLLLHFGLEAKFYRIVDLRSRKRRKTKGDTDPTNLTDLTDRCLRTTEQVATSDKKAESDGR